MRRYICESCERRVLLANPFTVGSSEYDTVFAAASMPDGGTVVGGLFKDTMDFDPTSGVFRLTSLNEDTDCYVARYSREGTLAWAVRFGGTEGELEDNEDINTPTDPARVRPFDLGVGLQTADLGEYVTDVVTDASGNIYVVGSFRGAVDFNPGSGVTTFASTDGNEFVDVYLLKLNANGVFQFARQIGGEFTDVPQALTIDSTGQLYLAGYFTRQADFDPTSGVSPLSTLEESRENAFIAKYNTSGLLVWARGLQNNEIDREKRTVANDIAVDAAGSVYVTGGFSGETDFDPSPVNEINIEVQDRTDAYILKLNSSGAFVWVKTFGNDGYDGGMTLALDPQGTSLYTGAYFEDQIDADPGRAIRPVFATPEEPGEDPDRSDLLISKFNAANGALQWARPFGSAGWETLGGMYVDDDGSVTITGAFYGAADFDPSRGRAVLISTLGVDDFEDPNDDDRDYSYDAFLWKLDTNGRYMFATRWGQAGDDYGLSLLRNTQGQPVVGGQFKGTYQFPESSSAKLRPYGLEDSFIALFDTDGVLVT